MFNFSSTATSPAIQNHLQTQMTFFADVSHKMIDGMQKLGALNIQVAKTVLGESTTSTKMLLSSKGGNDTLAVINSLAQPSLEKMRAYQQHVKQICADTQADVVKSIQSYVPESTRATEAVVREVTQKATDATATAAQRQQEAVEKIAAATKQNVERAAGSVIQDAERATDRGVIKTSK